MIPLAKDVRDAVGQFAERVENRSLLFEKMVLSKNWGHPGRFNDANRFNVLRASTGGSQLLGEDRDGAMKKASSPRARDDVKREARYRADVAGALATVPADNPEMIRRQVENANHLLRQLEQSYQGRVVTFVGALGGRLLINMAGGVMENAGMALDRCFGLPYLPGSAVKGVTRSAALWQIRRTGDATKRQELLRLALLAFGFVDDDLRKDFAWAARDDRNLARETGHAITKDGSFRGLCSFLPAYPTSEEHLKIVAEVLTPHFRDKQEPRPLFFPAVEKGSEFGFACCVQRKFEGVGVDDLLAQVKLWMTSAVTADGIGAKTGAGYGWFAIDENAEEKRRERMEEQARLEAERKAREEAEAVAAQAEVDRLAAMSPEQRFAEEISGWEAQQLAEFAKAIVEKPGEQQKAFCLYLSNVGKEHWKGWKRSKRWKDRLDPIRQTASQHGIELS